MKRNINNIYCADFETTSYQQALIDKKTRVWSWYTQNLSETDDCLGVFIEDYFDWIEDKNCSLHILFHNLNFDGKFIIDYFFANEQYSYVKDPFQKLNNGQFSFLDVPLSGIMLIRYKTFKGNLVKFTCSLKILQQKVSDLLGVDEKDKIDYQKYRGRDYQITPEEIIYIKKDVQIVVKYLQKYIGLTDSLGMTLSSTAFTIWKKRMYKEENYNRDFQVLNADEFVELKAWYRGGITILNPKWKNKMINEKIICYDVNSLYPFCMLKKMPVGKPIRCSDPKCRHQLSLLTINCYDVKVKKNGFGFINSKFGLFAAEFKDKLFDEKIKLTNFEYEMFCQNYDGYYTVDKNKICFECKENVFKEYIDYFYHLKEESVRNNDGISKKIAKLHLNSLYGHFGMDFRREKYVAVEKQDYYEYQTKYQYNNRQFVIESEETLLDKIEYIPVAIFITSYARCILIKAIQDNFANFIYGDTDSVMLIYDENKIINLDIDEYRLGAWKEEWVADAGKYLGRKNYVVKTNQDLNVAKFKEKYPDVLLANDIDTYDIDENICLNRQNNSDNNVITVKKMLKKITGINDKSKINLSNFDYGLVIEDGKLQAITFVGGCVLKPIKYRINERK